MAQNQYDAIVIGGGHNGLVAASYLARAGVKVVMLERREWTQCGQGGVERKMNNP